MGVRSRRRSVAPVVIRSDELDQPLLVAEQEIVLEQEPVFERAAIVRGLALRRWMIGLAMRMVHAALFPPCAKLG